MEEDNVWYRLGYTLERARERVAEHGVVHAPRESESARRPSNGRLRSPVERLAGRKVTPGADARPASPDRGSSGGAPWEAALAAAAAALAGRMLDRVRRGRKPGLVRLLRAGAAGAGAALLRELVRPLVTGSPRAATLAEIMRPVALGGAARGLAYGALVEPRIPGPPLARGAVYGLIEHLVSPWGGLTEMAGRYAPHRALPILSDLFGDIEPDDDTLVDHIVFGVALAALYGESGTEDGGNRGRDDAE